MALRKGKERKREKRKEGGGVKKCGLHDATEISSHQPPESDYEERRFE